VAFSDPPYGRIARHLGNEIEIHRDHRGLEPQASANAGRLAPCVPGADHDHFIVVGH
jgi:hypothetical protein